MKNTVLFYTLLLLLPLGVSAQTGQGSRATIMIVPHGESAEVILDKLNNDFSYATAVNEISRAFNREGHSTIDFVQKLKNALKNEVKGMENISDAFKYVIENSQADIIIEARININEDGKYGSSVNLILAALETSSAERLADSGGLKSGQNRSGNIADLVQKALQSEMIDSKSNESIGIAINVFIDDMREKFGAIKAVGRAITIKIEVNESCDYDMETFIGDEGDQLAGLIQDWIKKEAKGWYQEGLISDITIKKQGKSTYLLFYELFRIPFIDENGDSFDVYDFGRSLRKAIAVMGKKSEKGDFFRVRDNIDRNQISLTILD